MCKRKKQNNFTIKNTFEFIHCSWFTCFDQSSTTFFSVLSLSLPLIEISWREKMNKNTKKSYCRLLQQSAVPELKDKKVISFERSSPPLIFSKGNVHKGRPTIMGHFGHTYLPMPYVFYTMPITLVWLLLIPTYLPQNRTSFMNVPYRK